MYQFINIYWVLITSRNQGVVENYSKLPEHFKVKSREMFNKYSILASFFFVKIILF